MNVKIHMTNFWNCSIGNAITYLQDKPISNTSISGVLSTILPKGVFTPEGRVSMALLIRLLEQPDGDGSNIAQTPETEKQD